MLMDKGEGKQDPPIGLDSNALKKTGSMHFRFVVNKRILLMWLTVY